MSLTNTGRSDRDERLNRVLLAYVEATERGGVPDRQQFLQAHPEFAEELTEFFAGRDQLHHLTVPLKDLPAGEQPRRWHSGGPVTDGPAPTRWAAPTLGLAPEPGELGQLGEFHLLRELGRGGMGIVYEAEQRSLRRRVALKVLPFAAAMDPREIQRFHNEAQAAAQLHHPNIVPVYAVGSEGGVHYYAMQFIEGQSLAELIATLRWPARTGAARPRDQDPTPLDPDRAGVAEPAAARAAPDRPVDVMAAISAEHGGRSRPYFRRVASLGGQAASALEHAHRVGVVHRDIKPGNLLLDTDGKLWIADFGLASFSNGLHLTMTGEVVGTLLYTSPEQAQAQRGLTDHRTDVYSLGATLYELLTLRPIFESNDRRELYRQVLIEEPPPPRALERAIPVDLETIVLKAIAKDPTERYTSAQDLADDLERFLDDRPIRARRPTLVERSAKWVRRHRTLAAAVVVSLVLAVAGLGLTTALIAREQAKTSAAYQRERQKATEAAASFQQTRRAVDFFAELSQDEWLDQPGLKAVRWRLLERAVAYYQEFIDQHRNRPFLREELEASQVRLGQLQRQLSAIVDLNHFRYLRDQSVQDDLQLSAGQITQLTELLSAARPPRPMPPGTGDPVRRRQFVEQAAANREAVEKVLTVQQAARFRQIMLQQPGAHLFGTPEVLQGLDLTDEQKAAVRHIEVEARKKGSPDSFEREGDPEEGRQRYQAVWRAAIEKMVEVLKPEQRDCWYKMLGEPFQGKLRFPPPPPGPPGPESHRPDRGNEGGGERNTARAWQPPR